MILLVVLLVLVSTWILCEVLLAPDMPGYEEESRLQDERNDFID
jgi:hypothetical protein